MKKLWIINGTKNGNQATRQLLYQAAQVRNLNVETIFADEDFDFSLLPNVSKEDMVYRVSTSRSSGGIFKILGLRGASTVYRDDWAIRASGDNVVNNTILHEVRSINIIPTIFNVSTNRTLLDKYVKVLGGFPIVIKLAGGSHGVGVIRVDSSASLYSLMDMLSGQKARAIMRKYIQHYECARLAVLNGRVIDSIAYPVQKSDFRTNTGFELHPYVKKYSQDIEQLAIDAVEVLGCEFGGVDVLISDTEPPYVAEVNTPFYFTRSQQVSGADIAGMLIDHLSEKAAR